MWLVDQIWNMASLFDVEDHTITTIKSNICNGGELKCPKGVSEPVISFIKDVKTNPSRFEWYEGSTEVQYYSDETSFLIVDKVFNKSFTYNIIKRRRYSTFDYGCFMRAGFIIRGEDISWLTEEEKKLLLKLHSDMLIKKNSIKEAKVKRNQANKRRQMRKLYETK